MAVMQFERYPQSLWNVEDLLFERGYEFCQETLRLWRAVDHEGEELESYLTRQRDISADRAFMK